MIGETGFLIHYSKSIYKLFFKKQKGWISLLTKMYYIVVSFSTKEAIKKRKRDKENKLDYRSRFSHEDIGNFQDSFTLRSKDNQSKNWFEASQAWRSCWRNSFEDYIISEHPNNTQWTACNDFPVGISCEFKISDADNNESNDCPTSWMVGKHEDRIGIVIHLKFTGLFQRSEDIRRTTNFKKKRLHTWSSTWNGTLCSATTFFFFSTTFGLPAT